MSDVSRSRLGSAKGGRAKSREPDTAGRARTAARSATAPFVAPKSGGRAAPAPRSRKSASVGPAQPAFAQGPDDAVASGLPDADHRIDIRLDGAVTAVSIQDRYDIWIAGLVAASRPIEAVSLVVDGEVRSSCLYNRAAENRRVFRLGLFEREVLRGDLTAFEVVARTRDGHEGRAAFAIATGRDDPDGPRVVEGPVCEVSSPANALAPVLLYTETAAVNHAGELRVAGWSIALTQIVAINVFAGDRRIGAAERGLLRDDIARSFPAYPDSHMSGFAFFKPLPEGAAPDAIAVEVIDLSGSVSRARVPVAPGMAPAGEPPRAGLPAATMPATTMPAAKTPAQATSDRRRAIVIHCDEASLSTRGELLVTGWAVCAVGIAAVAVLLDGDVAGDAELALPRPDVGAEYALIPQARHSGFRLKLQVAPSASGDHRLDIRARNGLDDIAEITMTVAAGDRMSAASRSAPAAAAALAAPADPGEFRFALDHPVVIEGAVPHPVTGRLAIEGWAVARSGIEAIDVFLDGRMLGQAYHGTARRDVEAAFPDWSGSFRSGFIFHLPPRVLETGAHDIRLQLRAKGGWSFDSEFRIDVQQSQDIEDYAAIRRRISRAETDLYLDILDRLGCRPNFRLLLAAPGPAVAEKIVATLRAMGDQAYSNWHLAIAADAARHEELLAIADRAGLREHVTLISADAALGAVAVASTGGAPCLVGVLSAGDELGCDALAEFAVARGLHADAQFFYADEDRVSATSNAREPFFKPDWSPDLLLSTNYIGRPWFATADLLTKAGITPRSLLAPHGDYDAVLRCTELASRVYHLPKLLCRRDDDAAEEQDAERRVLQATAVRRGIAADVLPGCLPGTWRLKRTAPARGKVSIIIPTCAAKGYVATCLESLRAKTRYRDFEIICIDNIPANMAKWKRLIRQGADTVVDMPAAFNWSRFNNRAARQATGKYLLFLNDDIEVQQTDWLDALLEHAQRPEVGIVGPQLLYPDRKVQHAGIFLTTLGAGRHSFRFLAEKDPGYFGLALTQRNVAAVTGACMLMRRAVFERLGRFDERHLVVNNDVDCCLRSWRAGLSVVYTPHAQLIHHELASRANMQDEFDAGHFAKQWRTFYAAGDPFFSPRLSKFADEYRPDTEPARLICASRPLFRQAAIRRILAVKLDHIGDLITALPALRRLRQHFPAARIHLLASAAARAFLAGDDCVDEFIEFEFFHARSGHGQKDLTSQDLRALGERLAPYRFDLALDLRKQLETRHVLEYVPARLRAGYNHHGRFPWLDVALEWEGDNRLHRKQSHVGDDLVRLVDAVAMAGEAVRAVPPRAMTHGGRPLGGLPAAARALFRRPVVAVHPASGPSCGNGRRSILPR
jgi:O-antigen biosynthesis protein